MKKLFYISSLAVLLLFSSCFEDLDDTITPATTIDIQDFIYRGLSFFYLYKADTPELATDAFSSEQAKNNFLSNYQSPEALFEYLKSDQDRFSVFSYTLLRAHDSKATLVCRLLRENNNMLMLYY